MKNLALLLFWLSLLTFVACGGANGPSNPPPSLNASYSFIANSAIAGTNIFTFGGPVQTDPSGNVTANLGIASLAPTNTCFPAGTAISFTGTLNAAGQLALTSAPVAGQVISLTSTVSTDGNNLITTASYTVTGGCLAGDHGRLFVSRMLTGPFTGAFLAGGSLINVTMNFGPMGMPAANGDFPVNATASFTNATGCGFASASTSSGAQNGLAVGFTMASNVAGSSLTFNGTTIDQSGVQFSGQVVVSGGPCDQAKAQVTLKRS